RFSSAKEVAELLRAELAHLQAPQITKQPPRVWRRFRWSWTAVSLSTIAAAIVLGAAAWGISRWFRVDVVDDPSVASEGVWVDDRSISLLKERVSRLLEPEEVASPVEERTLIDLGNRVRALHAELKVEQESE